MHLRRGTYLLSSLTLIGLIGLGCGFGDKMSEMVGEELAEKVVESQGGGDVEFDIGGDVDISGLADYCRYPGAKATGKVSVSTAEGSGSQYILETNDSVSTVVTWYKNQFSAWSTQFSVETPEGTQLIFNRPNTDEVVHLIVAKSDAVTNIMVNQATAPGAGANSGTGTVQVHVDGSTTSVKTDGTSVTTDGGNVQVTTPTKRPPGKKGGKVKRP